ncbi:MAG TPA: 50S ribosomal protein L11 methyltransferase [Opitutaceae bacterium]|nr:50S ribosomal protein L11 methyltransferase [Opitutaceae bacterium]
MIELSVPVVADQVDLLEETLLEIGDARWMVLQDLPTAQSKLIGVFADESEAEDAWQALVAAAVVVRLPSRPNSRILAEADWRNSYKAHFKAWHFGKLHWVPIWERETYAAGGDDKIIWLDPGLAFGTGNHETTRLCCERLVSLTQDFGFDVPVIDAGCGSGILALSAARLGYRNVIGFDNDPEAIAVSRENAEMNGLLNAVEFFVGDLVTGLANRKGGIVLANIQADVLMAFSDQLLGSVLQPGALVLSGILARENDQVREHFVAKARGWKIEARVMNEWSDLLLIRS